MEGIVTKAANKPVISETESAAARTATGLSPGETASALIRLMAPADFASAHQHLFPSVTSLSWYMRVHRAALLEAGALMMVRGRLMIDPEPFGRVYIELAKAMAGHSVR